MIDVSVREQHSLDLVSRERWLAPVQLAQLAVTLKHAGVDDRVALAVGEQISATP